MGEGRGHAPDQPAGAARTDAGGGAGPSADRRQVRLDGVRCWGEMGADAQDIHISGAIVLLGRLLWSHIATALRNIL
jgi:hypothetical protein